MKLFLFIPLLTLLFSFSAHHSDWFGSNNTDFAGTQIFNFSISQSLTQIVNFPTRIPDNAIHSPSLLDLCLVSQPDMCTVSCETPLGRSDHVVVSLCMKQQATITASPYHRILLTTIWKGIGIHFRDFLRDAPLDNFFSLSADNCAAEVTKWIQSGIESFVPHQRFQVKLHSSPWFSAACAAAISHCNHFFRQYCRNKTPENKRFFSTARNHCRKVLDVAKAAYSALLKNRISTHWHV